MVKDQLDDFSDILVEAVKKIKLQKQRPNTSRIIQIVKQTQNWSEQYIVDHLEDAVEQGFLLKCFSRGEMSFNNSNGSSGISKSMKVNASKNSDITRAILRTLRDVIGDSGLNLTQIEEHIRNDHTVVDEVGVDLPRQIRICARKAVKDGCLSQFGKLFRVPTKSNINGQTPPQDMASGKKIASPVALCSFCMGNKSKNRDGNSEILISCADCGNSGHPTCLKFSPDLTARVIKTRWQCLDCKTCSICDKAGLENNMLFCDWCDCGIHMECCSPPLTRPPKGSWICIFCKESELPTSMLNSRVSKNSHKKGGNGLKGKRALNFEETNGNSTNEEQPKGLIDGLSRFFTPSNKRKSRSLPHSDDDVYYFTPIKKGKTTKGSSQSMANKLIQKSRKLRASKPARGLFEGMASMLSHEAASKVMGSSFEEKGHNSTSEDEVIEVGIVESHDASPKVVSARKNSARAKSLHKASKDNSETNQGKESTAKNSQDVCHKVDKLTYQKKKSRNSVVVKDSSKKSGSSKKNKQLQNENLISSSESEPCVVACVKECDKLLYEKALVQSSEYLESVNADFDGPFPPVIEFGHYEISTWYSSPYPQEYARLRRLYLCEFCLKYIKSKSMLVMHKKKCNLFQPPANEIYRKNNLSVFEVDGNSNKIYCQNLCLLAKLFLDHKTLYYDVEPFLFYVLTKNDKYGCHLIGYFSKEKHCQQKYNVSCIMTMPQYQRKGYGRFLIDFSYLLSRVEGQPGSPEKPLSELGMLSYRAYWRSTLLVQMQSFDPHQKVSIKSLCQATGMSAHDIADTLQSMGMLAICGNKIVLMKDTRAVAKQMEKTNHQLNVDPDALRWSPLVSTACISDEELNAQQQMVPQSRKRRSSVMSQAAALKEPSPKKLRIAEKAQDLEDQVAANLNQPEEPAITKRVTRRSQQSSNVSAKDPKNVDAPTPAKKIRGWPKGVKRGKISNPPATSNESLPNKRRGRPPKDVQKRPLRRSTAPIFSGPYIIDSSSDDEEAIRQRVRVKRTPRLSKNIKRSKNSMNKKLSANDLSEKDKNNTSVVDSDNDGDEEDNNDDNEYVKNSIFGKISEDYQVEQDEDASTLACSQQSDNELTDSGVGPENVQSSPSSSLSRKEITRDVVTENNKLVYPQSNSQCNTVSEATCSPGLLSASDGETTVQISDSFQHDANENSKLTLQSGISDSSDDCHVVSVTNNKKATFDKAGKAVNSVNEAIVPGGEKKNGKIDNEEKSKGDQSENFCISVEEAFGMDNPDRQSKDANLSVTENTIEDIPIQERSREELEEQEDAVRGLCLEGQNEEGSSCEEIPCADIISPGNQNQVDQIPDNEAAAQLCSSESAIDSSENCSPKEGSKVGLEDDKDEEICSEEEVDASETSDEGESQAESTVSSKEGTPNTEYRGSLVSSSSRHQISSVQQSQSEFIEDQSATGSTVDLHALSSPAQNRSCPPTIQPPTNYPPVETIDSSQLGLESPASVNGAGSVGSSGSYSSCPVSCRTDQSARQVAGYRASSVVSQIHSPDPSYSMPLQSPSAYSRMSNPSPGPQSHYVDSAPSSVKYVPNPSPGNSAPSSYMASPEAQQSNNAYLASPDGSQHATSFNMPNPSPGSYNMPTPSPTGSTGYNIASPSPTTTQQIFTLPTASNQQQISYTFVAQPVIDQRVSQNQNAIFKLEQLANNVHHDHAVIPQVSHATTSLPRLAPTPPRRNMTPPHRQLAQSPYRFHHAQKAANVQFAPNVSIPSTGNVLTGFVNYGVPPQYISPNHTFMGQPGSAPHPMITAQQQHFQTQLQPSLSSYYSYSPLSQFRH